MFSIRSLTSGLAALILSSATASAAPAPDVSGKAAVVEIGRYAFVTQEQADYLGEALDAAIAGGAAAIVLKIDCPGGLASEVRRFVKQLSDVEKPVIAWVEGRAAGAGAFAALAADKVFLKEGDRWIGGEVEAIDWRGPKEALPTRLTDQRYWNVSADLISWLGEKGVPAEVVAGLAEQKAVVIGGEEYAVAGDVLEIDAEVGAALNVVDGSASDLASVLDGLEPVVLPAPDDVIVRPVEAQPESAEQSEAAPPEPAAEESPTDASDEESGDRKFGETKMESYRDKIVVIEVSEETLMRPTKFEFMQRIVEKANDEDARAIIFDMDSPGGALWQTMSQMLKHLQNLDVPTYTYVNTRAISAGSMIAISTDHIYMHPPSTIGASAPVAGGGQDIEGAMYEKIISTFQAVAKDVAPLKGRDPDLVLAFIELEKSYSARIPVIDESGALDERVVVEVGSDDLLSLGSREAAEVVDGRPLLADGIAKTLEEVIDQAGLEGEVVHAKPLGFEAVSDWLVKIGPWLMLFGMAGAYMEMKAPGFGIPGFIAVICFGLFFFGHKAAGFLAGYEAIGVFLLGVVCLVVELFVFPGLLVFGAAGLLMIFGSLIYAMVDPIDLGWGGTLDLSNFVGALAGPAFNVLLALIGAGVLILLALRYLPSTPAMRWLVLQTGVGRGTGLEIAGEAGSLAAETGEDGKSALVGQSGTAETDLRPAGSARIAGERIDVVTSGNFIAHGAAVRVVEVDGTRIVVEEIESLS